MFNPEEYDSWYARHSDIYRAELETLREIVEKYPSPKLEIGVGTGRFASQLGIDYGIDPDEAMLQYARRRGVKGIKGVGEFLPFENEYFYAVVIVTTLPFFKEVEKVIKEAYRVLKSNGGLIIGFIPKDSYFGRKYTEMGKRGDKRFSNAHFFTMEEVEKLLEDYFYIVRVRSTLLGENVNLRVIDGFREDASFVVVEGRKIE